MDRVKQERITILAVGDKQDYDSYLKFDRERNSILRSKFDYVNTDYNRLLKKGIPALRTEKVIVFLFFPFAYWNRYIEHRNYKGIYGSRLFYKKFNRFWDRVGTACGRSLKKKRVFFVNSSFLCGRYRDKLAVRNKLLRAGIPSPRIFPVSRPQEIRHLLRSGESLFLKPRYGSMGKGITFLSKSSWKTNFLYRGGRIMSRKSDRGWKFRDITGNYAFLRKLIRNDILTEKAIDSITVKKKKVDMRVYVFFNRVMYIYPRKNDIDSVTTNISQGAQGDPRLLRKMPKPIVDRTRKVASRVSRALKLNLAGMDIMVDRNRRDIYVIDVNLFPGFPKRKTFNFSRSLIRRLADLRDKGKLRFSEY